MSRDELTNEWKYHEWKYRGGNALYVTGEWKHGAMIQWGGLIDGSGDDPS